MDRYAIGIDLGSAAARLVLISIENGTEICSFSVKYKHGNIGLSFNLPSTAVIHHPQDYLDVIYIGIPALIRMSGISCDKIISLGIAGTTSTVLATDAYGTPMCFFEKYKTHPNAYIKLWKDHSAQNEADLLNIILEKTNLGKISAEWLLPKAIYVLNNDPELYNEMDKFIEVSDWLVWHLTGNELRSSSQASFTSLWSRNKGFLDPNILKQVDERLFSFTSEKLAPDFYPPTKSAGFIKEEKAQKLGLGRFVIVSVASIDAIATFPALGVTSQGKLISVIGTSSCHMLLSNITKEIPDVTKVKDAIFPGYNTYISDQVAVGDCFDWFFNNMVPQEYYIRAKQLHQNIRTFFEGQMLLEKHKCNCLALDWWNGSRRDSSLKGLIWGLDINTKPEEIYLALIESTAFGLRYIIDKLEKNGLRIDEICAAGGVSHNSPFILQIYSNITNKKISVSRSTNATALGAAIFSSVAAGEKYGGYNDITTASKKMGGIQENCYCPQKMDSLDEKYLLYRRLRDFFQTVNLF